MPAVADKLAARRSEGWKVLFTRDTHGADYLDTQEGRRLSVPHCIWGTEGWQITLLPWRLGKLLWWDKPTFGSLDLAEAAANLGEPEEIELVGLCTDICVISNAMILKARFPEARVLVDAACCAGVTPREPRERPQGHGGLPGGCDLNQRRQEAAPIGSCLLPFIFTDETAARERSCACAAGPAGEA